MVEKCRHPLQWPGNSVLCTQRDDRSAYVVLQQHGGHARVPILSTLAVHVVILQSTSSLLHCKVTELVHYFS
jgi:hypothetical protein